jgi:hypothetical protein
MIFALYIAGLAGIVLLLLSMKLSWWRVLLFSCVATMYPIIITATAVVFAFVLTIVVLDQKK